MLNAEDLSKRGCEIIANLTENWGGSPRHLSYLIHGYFNSDGHA